MNTQHLQYIIEIERTRSISQAAENLFIGQPNLSRILHDVEQMLGFRIFERSTRGVRPTTRGTIFLQHAKSILRETEDGFRIAEEDLKLRGEGELLGTRQSGTPGFLVASLEAHGDLLEIARKDAAYLLERDPELTGERGEAIRTLLYLYRRDEAIRFLRAG